MEDKVSLCWRKSSYSGNGGGNCVEVAARGSSVLVRDTRQDGAGPVLRFSPAAWRRFADRVGRSLASDLDLGLLGTCAGRFRVRGCPFCLSRWFFTGRRSELPEFRQSGCWFPPVRGAAYCSSRLWRVKRALWLRKGRGRVRGYRETRAQEVSRVPDACGLRHRQARRGIRVGDA